MLMSADVNVEAELCKPAPNVITMKCDTEGKVKVLYTNSLYFFRPEQQHDHVLIKSSTVNVDSRNIYFCAINIP